jgi:hypothetical protein
MLEQARLNSGERIEYASGLLVSDYRGLPTVDHSGGDASYRSDMRRFPTLHFTAAVLCNAAEANPNRLVRQVADIVLAKHLASDVNPAKLENRPVTADQRSSVPGLYWNPVDKAFARVTVRGDALQIEM